MEKPGIAAKQPEVLTLGAGTYFIGVSVDGRGISRFVTGPTKGPGPSWSSLQ